VDRRDRLVEHLQRVTHLTRSVMLKRALTAAEPKPCLNFWRLIYGSQLDIAVIEWCKLFGSDAEATHWKKLVPESNHAAFRSTLLTSIGRSPNEWKHYWHEMKKYRDNIAAHHNSSTRVNNYPRLDIALSSSYFYYNYLIVELRAAGVREYPDSLKSYAVEFRLLADKVAVKAIAATNSIKESVY